MRIFGKARKRTKSGRGVTRAALAGANLTELMRGALSTLLAESGADRAGVWTQGGPKTGDDTATLSFSGIVIDQDQEATPVRWQRFSPDQALLRALLCDRSVEQELQDSPEQATIAVLVGMRKAVWAPICTHGTLNGVVFAAARTKKATLDKAAVESVAAELALALELTRERRRSQEQQYDVANIRRMLVDLSALEDPDSLLKALVEGCTSNRADEFGPRANFTAIGERIDSFPPSAPSDNTFDEHPFQDADDAVIEFRWRSGDPSWTCALETEPNALVWRQALERRCVTGSEIIAGNMTGAERIVALPLQGNGQILGVLVAGWPQGNASLANLERLELRAAVAAQALLQRRRNCVSQQERAWNEAVLESTTDAIILLDAHRKIAAVSTKARELLQGLYKTHLENPKEPSHRILSFTHIFPSREWQRIQDWMDTNTHASAQNPAEHAPLESELGNGIGVCLRLVGSRAGGFSAVLLDPMRQDQTKTRAEAELFNVVQWLEEGVVLFDSREEIRVMNSRFAQMAGLTPAESVDARTLNGLITRMAPQTAAPEDFAARWRALAHGSDSGVREELQFVRPTPRVLERVARPVLDASGGRLGRVELYRDLTAHRAFHSKLMQTEKLAALGQMVTSTAHELSNPLTSILGYAQRLLSRNRGEEEAEVRQIYQEAERASSILKQLLLTARSTGPERRKVSLNDVVRRTVELQRFSLAAENTRVELDLGSQLPSIIGDAGQLQQVLMNLIGNARQAIELGGKPGRIQLRTRYNKENGVFLEVIDNGPGIPDSIVSRIFDPFFTTKPAGMGTGLGLSIVLGIVREHGGQVRVMTSPGGGATFSIELPMVPAFSYVPQATLSEETAEEELIEPAEAALAPWAGSLVLIVEDEATVARLIADVLEDAGLTVDAVLDGREALRRAASEDYQLVICDMKMPSLDGEQFFKLLSRTNPSLARRMLFVTGDVLAARTLDFLERQHLPHVAKPFRVEELTEKVRQVLADTSPRTSRGAKTNVARH